MLHEFLMANRAEVLERCGRKAARRFDPAPVPPDAGDGLPLFLEQLADTLRTEREHPTIEDTAAAPAPTEIGRAAALHGARLLRQGYTIDQVVHDYGDVCQSVTELALEREEPIATGDFRVLNRCLDNAIADAVAAYSRDRQAGINDGAAALGARLDSLSDDQRRLLDSAIQSFVALQTGKLGLTGATAVAHLHSLHALRALADVSLSAVRLESAKTTLPPYAKP